MKKTYMAPAIDVKKFDVADIITTSVVTPSTTAEIKNDNGANKVEIVAKW